MILKWIQNALTPKSKGKLRKKLHVKKGKKIPAKKLAKAAKSSNPKLRKEAQLAETLRKLQKKKKAKKKAKMKVKKRKVNVKKRKVKVKKRKSKR